MFKSIKTKLTHLINEIRAKLYTMKFMLIIRLFLSLKDDEKAIIVMCSGKKIIREQLIIIELSEMFSNEDN